MCVPTSSRVSRGTDQKVGIQPALGLRQPVSNLLESLGESGIIEDEADIILRDSQPFPGSIDRGVEDAPEVDPASGLAQIQRWDSLRRRQRRHVRQGRLGQTLAQGLRLEPRRREQLGRPSAGGQQAG